MRSTRFSGPAHLNTESAAREDAPALSETSSNIILLCIWRHSPVLQPV